MKQLFSILLTLSFSVCNSQITYFASASNPADNGTASGSGTVSITPPSSMLEGDLILVFTHSRTASNTHDIGSWGGQVWKTLSAGSTTVSTAQTFWTRFNGSWLAGGPAFSFNTTTSTSVIMHVFRGPSTTSWWTIDVAQATSTYSAPSTPFTVSRTGQTTVADTTVTVAAWYSVDDNTWGNISGTGWVVTGDAQYRNLAGSDNSASFAHKLQTAQAATGNVSKQQTALGGDAGQTSIVTFRCSRTPRTPTVYYISPSGNDGNAGTSTGSPFRNWQKLKDVAQRGDSIYMMDGIFVPTTDMATSYIHCFWELLEGTSTQPIVICNYPGATPVYDFHGYTTTRAGGCEAVFLYHSNFIKISGLRITGLNQITDGSGISRGFTISDCSDITVERCVVDSMGGTGFMLGNANNVTYLNNDAHHCYDPYTTPAYDGADGFASTAESSTNTVYTGNRSWFNADDGFDFFSTDGVRIMTRNLAMFNGYLNDTTANAGNGNGYKLGPTASDKSTDTTKKLNANLAIKNRNNGFDQNNGQTLYKMNNNLAYRNGLYGYEWAYYGSIIQDFKNNIGYANGSADVHGSGSNVPATYNSWNGVVTVNNADFTNFIYSSLLEARQSNGDPPVSTFMNLVPGSDLIDAGTDVGYGNDMGPFQYVPVVTGTGGFFIFF